jgi:hypothetical protein
MMIRHCTPGEVDDICAVINDAASAYRGIIAADRWKDPHPRGYVEDRDVGD